MIPAIALVLVVGGSTTTAAEIDSYIRKLASPEFSGRLTLSDGERQAADYIAQHFRRIGLQEGPNPGYLHYFDITVNQRPTRNNFMQLILPNGERKNLVIGEDYMPLANSRTRTVNAGLVFVGYGMKVDGWDDYAGVDVKDKVVIAFRGAPEGRQPLANRQKARLAEEQGAKGIVFVGPVADGRRELPVTSNQQGFTRVQDFVGAGLHSRWFEPLVGVPFQSARKMTKPASKPLGASIRFLTEMEPNAGKGRNVIGYLPGNDPKLKDEYIIVGGHFDHLGYGETGSRTGVEKLHPGADDNASGTAAVMALARYFAERKENRRTIIFQAYSGEEIGLVGSAAWANGHLEELKRTSAMINMDMLGRVRDGQTFVFGTSTTTKWPEILGAVQVPGLTLVQRPNSRNDSDQASFARHKVPILFFHTGLHDEYHTENDVAEKIVLDGVVKVVDAVRQTVEAIDRLDERLTWNAEAEMGSRPTDRATRPGGEPGQGRRVRIGFIPDMTSGGPGVLLAGVTQGTPAEKAGLKAGDRVIRMGERKIDTIDDMQQAMTDARPGVKIAIVVIRDGAEVTVDLIPEAPGGG
jgi:hypothetical protein